MLTITTAKDDILVVPYHTNSHTHPTTIYQQHANHSITEHIKQNEELLEHCNH